MKSCYKNAFEDYVQDPYASPPVVSPDALGMKSWGKEGPEVYMQAAYRSEKLPLQVHLLAPTCDKLILAKACIYKGVDKGSCKVLPS